MVSVASGALSTDKVEKRISADHLTAKQIF